MICYTVSCKYKDIVRTLSNVETPADPLVESVNVEVSDRHGNFPVSMRGRYVNVLLIRTEICFK